MRLHGLCYYRSKSDEWTNGWRNVDYAARNLVKAIKHSDFRGSSKLTINGTNYTIDNTAEGRARALAICAGALASKITQAGYAQVAVIPIPSSTHTNPNAMFTGRRISEAIQAKNASFVSTPVLHFDTPLPKAAGGGGTRNANAIQGHIRLANCQLPETAILIDDVCTSGGHLKAAARFLAQSGIQIHDAFVIGRTAWKQPEHMFAVQPEEIITANPFDW